MIIHLDLTELVANPLRSGIQRVEREAIRHWPVPGELVPCLIDRAGNLRRLPAEALEVLCATDDGSQASRGAESAMLGALAADAEPLADTAVSRLLNLELFFDPVRADAHIRLAGSGVQVMWYLYDFLPFLRPELFPPGTARHCMHFLRALRHIDGGLAFLSRATRDQFFDRIAHGMRPVGAAPVIDPGADGLGLERQQFMTQRRDFVAIGTIERRKNTGALLRAFEHLWETGVQAPLVVAGRMAQNDEEARAFFSRHAGNPLFTFLDQPSDESLRQVLRRARAVVMPSEAEGFGLPPYEALHAGIPAIASAALPCAPMLEGGAVLLPRMGSEDIAAAVARLCDDDRAAALWADASRVKLPEWSEFGQALGAWARTA